MAHHFDSIKDSGLEYLKVSFGEEAVERAIDFTMRFMVELPGYRRSGGKRMEQRSELS